MAASGVPDPAVDRIPVLVIGGPTCSGKSALAIELAKVFEAEIISADSRQIYRSIRIGTDRMEPSQWQGIAHHLLGMVDLGERFTVFDFVREASRVIKDIHRRNKKVIVCGGTGLYLHALTDGIFEIQEDDLTYRQELLDLAAREGPAFMYERLRQVDPREAQSIHPNNLVRVIRALEIYHLTGRPKSEWIDATTAPEDSFNFLQIKLMPDRDRLYKLIENRVDRMMAAGLLEETRSVWNSSKKEDLHRCKIVGYNELIEYLEGQLSLEEAVGMIKQNTRRFAKRQYTWFRGSERAQVIEEFGWAAVESGRRLAETLWGPAHEKT